MSYSFASTLRERTSAGYAVFNNQNTKPREAMTNMSFGGDPRAQESSTAYIASESVFGQIAANPRILAHDGYWTFLKTAVDNVFTASAQGKQPTIWELGVLDGLARVTDLTESPNPLQSSAGILARQLIEYSMETATTKMGQVGQSSRRAAGQSFI